MIGLYRKANQEVTTLTLYEDVYNIDKQGGVNQLKRPMEEIETRKTKRAVIRSKINDNK